MHQDVDVAISRKMLAINVILMMKMLTSCMSCAKIAMR